MKITFKNVDQGDSIILEWKENNKNQIAIIDCNLNEKKENPVLDFIVANNYDEIKYIILSHPHTDHFSGLPELFQYCLDNGIIIRYFMHTSTMVPAFLKMANHSKIAATKIQQVFKILRECRTKLGPVIGTIAVGSKDEIALGDDHKLTLLAPTSVHADNYAAKIPYESDYEVEGNSPDANWLSTVFKLENKDNNYLLLTSDTPKEVLKEIGITGFSANFSGRNLLLGQSPHHGAAKNHNNSFWKKLGKSLSCPILFSVGRNHYKHPSKIAIDFFKKEKFILYSTNEVGEFLLNYSKSTIVNSSLLDNFSKKSSTKINSELSGDHSFIMHDHHVEAI